MKLYQNKAYVYFILKGREVHDYIRRNLVVLCWSYWYVHVYWHIQYGVSIKHHDDALFKCTEHVHSVNTYRYLSTISQGNTANLHICKCVYLYLCSTKTLKLYHIERRHHWNRIWFLKIYLFIKLLSYHTKDYF